MGALSPGVKLQERDADSTLHMIVMNYDETYKFTSTVFFIVLCISTWYVMVSVKDFPSQMLKFIWG
jgi:hypothetical protein